MPGNHGSGLVRVYPDLEALSYAAATLTVHLAMEAVAARGRFGVALSGGNTPRRAYEILGQPHFREQAPWDRIHVFWGDERCVPLADPRSNARMAREAWLDQVPIPRDQVHPIECSVSPEMAAAQYETLLKSSFGRGATGLDLVLLGLGEDGHTASLFPGTPVVRELTRWVAPVYLAEPGLNRVTLTAPFINQAAVAVFLVAGPAKAGVLHEVLHGPYDPDRLPAQLIRPKSGELLWLVDREAAAELG